MRRLVVCGLAGRGAAGAVECIRRLQARPGAGVRLQAWQRRAAPGGRGGAQSPCLVPAVLLLRPEEIPCFVSTYRMLDFHQLIIV